MKKRLILLGLAAGWLAWRRSKKPSQDLNNQVIIVTGASAGIGKAAAHAFASQGAKVVLVARRADVLELVKYELAQYGQPVLAIPADVTNDDDLQRIVDTIIGEFGRIDVLVNNAGLSMGGHFEANNPNQIRKLLNVNLYGLMRLTQLTLPTMIKQGGGHIVNISSVASIMGSAGQVVYGASKAAVNSFSNSIRREYRSRGIRVSTVLPGWTRTDMTAGMDEQKMHDAHLLGVGMVMDEVQTIASGVVDAVRFNRRFMVFGGWMFQLSSLAFINHSFLLDFFFHCVFNADKMTDVMDELGTSL